MADQPHEQQNRSQREHQHQPAEGEDEPGRPVNVAAFQGERKHPVENSRGDILHQYPGQQVEIGAEPLLVQGAVRDRQQGRHAKAEAGRTDSGDADTALADDDRDPGEPDEHPEHFQAPEILPQPYGGQEHGDQRLQTHDERTETRVNTPVDGGEHAPEVDAVNQDADHRDVKIVARTLRPSNPKEGNQDAQGQHHDQHSHTEKGERLCSGQAVLGGDETRAPEGHEQQRDQVSRSHVLGAGKGRDRCACPP